MENTEKRRGRYGLGKVLRLRRLQLSMSNEEYSSLRQAAATLKMPMAHVLYKCSRSVLELCAKLNSSDREEILEKLRKAVA